MSIPRVKGTGWGLNEKLTSAQMTLVDQQLSQMALDKTGAGDTLAGLIAVSAAAGFVFASASICHFLSGAGPTFDSGAFIAFQSGAAVALTCGISGATLTAASGIAWVLNGTVTVGGAAVFNGATTFNGTVTVAGTNKVLLGARSIERMTTTMMRNENALTSAQWQLSVPAGDSCDHELNVPHGATLTDVRIWVFPNHAPPAGTKINLDLIRRDNAGNIQSLAHGGVATTDPNTGGAYAANHTFLLSAGGSVSAVIDRTQYRYFAVLNGEGGSGAAAVLMAGTSAIFTPASYDDGAA